MIRAYLGRATSNTKAIERKSHGINELAELLVKQESLEREIAS